MIMHVHRRKPAAVDDGVERARKRNDGVGPGARKRVLRKPGRARVLRHLIEQQQNVKSGLAVSVFS